MDTLDNLPRFLDHLEHRDAPAAQFARELLDAGASVLRFIGPVQMDVWELRVQRGEMIVRFGVERGYSDGVSISHNDWAPSPNGGPWDGLLPMGLAVIAWAAARGTALTPATLPSLATVPPDQRFAALAWVGEGHDVDVRALLPLWSDYAWKQHRLTDSRQGEPMESDRTAASAAATALIEAVTRR